MFRWLRHSENKNNQKDVFKVSLKKTSMNLKMYGLFHRNKDSSLVSGAFRCRRYSCWCVRRRELTATFCTADMNLHLSTSLLIFTRHNKQSKIMVWHWQANLLSSSKKTSEKYQLMPGSFISWSPAKIQHYLKDTNRLGSRHCAPCYSYLRMA